MTADSSKPTGFPAHTYPSYTAPGMYHTVKLSYGVDNPGEVGSIAVYPPSWIRVNSVRKVANATLQSEDEQILAFSLDTKWLQLPMSKFLQH